MTSTMEKLTMMYIKMESMANSMTSKLSSKQKKAISNIALALAVLPFVGMMCMGNAYATDIFTKAESMMDTIYISIAGISTVAAGLFAAIAFFQMITATDDRKAGQCIERIKTIAIAWIALMLMATILRFVATNLFGSDSKASLKGIG